MAIIGNFTKQDNAYQGTIATLSVNAKATITPVEKKGEQSPDFRVFAGKAETRPAPSSFWSAMTGNCRASIGAACSARSRIATARRA